MKNALKQTKFWKEIYYLHEKYKTSIMTAILGSKPNLFIGLLLLCFLSSPIFGQQHYPASDWERKTPSSLGLDNEIISDAQKYAESNEYSGAKDLRLAILEGFAREPYHKILGPTKHRGGPAGMIIKNGYVVAEWGDIDRVDMTFSVTKSYLSTIAGLAIDHKLIKDVHDQVSKYVWDGTFRGVHNEKVSWDHLLTQSSDWSGSLFGVKDWADRPPQDGGVDDWKYRQLKEPGTFFEYNDVRVNVLAYSLLQVWRKPLPQILKKYVMDPIGASPTWRWFGYDHSMTLVDGMQMQSVSGGGHSGGGVFISASDHARFGLLFCRNGQWNGDQIISSNWVVELQKPSTANQSYGYMWWLNKGDRTMEGVPDHVYYAAGFGGNFIIVDQEEDMVIVTRWLEPAKLAEFLQIIYR